MFRDDLERSGFAEGSTVGDSVEVLWSIPNFNVTGYGAAKGSPSVVGNMLFCGTDTGRFLAARIDNGEVLWQVRLIPTSHGIHGSPAIVGDVVYIGAYDGTVYAFERMTGLLLWRHKLGFQVGSSPAVVPQWGVVYSAHEESPSGGGFVLALDARTGRELWQSRTSAHPHSSVAVDVARQTVFVGDNRGILYALDAMSGHERWTRELDRADGKTDIKTTPMVVRERGIVVFGAWPARCTRSMRSRVIRPGNTRPEDASWPRRRTCPGCR
jgi:outer membrane protein assembly factor BamB